MNEQRIYRAALAAWGADAQTLMVFEEMSELQKELCKAARGKDNTEQIAEEIADVEIMLEQMKVLHDCAKAVAAYRKSKLRRLAVRCGADVEPQEGQKMAYNVYFCCDKCGGYLQLDQHFRINRQSKEDSEGSRLGSGEARMVLPKMPQPQEGRETP